MKKVLPSLALMVLACACGGSEASKDQGTPSSTSAPAPTVQDRASLLTALRAEGARVEEGAEVEQRFFSVKGQIVKLNGADVQVFEYVDDRAAAAEAKKVAPDASQVGDLSVGWAAAAPPHFYTKGRVIVLYTGSDSVVTDPLERTLGPQFAGR